MVRVAVLITGQEPVVFESLNRAFTYMEAQGFAPAAYPCPPCYGEFRPNQGAAGESVRGKTARIESWIGGCC